jgi:2-hydroxychromene-2-carboxylate isomerase
MASSDVLYFFSLASPFSYLGHVRFVALAGKYKARVHFKPADMSVVFPKTGGLPVKQRSPQRQAYRLLELRRWRDFLGVPLNIEPKYFPVADQLAARTVIAAEQTGEDPGTITFAIMKACWADDKNIADRETLASVVNDLGLDGPVLLREAESEAVKQEYIANTQDALNAGVFGVPSYVYKGELFWGQDRLDFLERAFKKG